MFKIERQGEAVTYGPFKELHNRKLLWHGSRTTNFAGILSQGLRIAPPEAPVVSKKDLNNFNGLISAVTSNQNLEILLHSHRPLTEKLTT